MTSRLLITLLIVSVVAGCGRIAGSRVNPLNWFGGSEEVRAQNLPSRRAVDPRGLVAQVISLRIEAVAGGAIVHATGLPPSQGYFDGDLVPENDERAVNGVLTYQFRISAPPTATPAGPQRSREVIVARFVSQQVLADVNAIRVAGAANALQSRR